MDSGCCLQLLEDGDSKSKTASNMFTETEGLKDNLSGDEEDKNQSMRMRSEKDALPNWKG